MNDKVAVEKTVDSIVEELKRNPSTRFSKSDFQLLVWGILADKDFRAKKYLLRNGDILETEVSVGSDFYKFLDKLLKHAGVANSAERSMILESFEYNSRDMEWIVDAVDEASYIYTECGKNLKVFREKMLQLTLKKMVRSGKYDGKITYKKTVVDRALALKKKSESK